MRRRDEPAGRSSPGISRAKTERKRAGAASRDPRDKRGGRAARLALAGCETGGGWGPGPGDDGKLVRTRSEIIRPRQKNRPDNIQNTSSEQVTVIM